MTIHPFTALNFFSTQGSLFGRILVDQSMEQRTMNSSAEIHKLQIYIKRGCARSFQQIGEGGRYTNLTPRRLRRVSEQLVGIVETRSTGQRDHGGDKVGTQTNRLSRWNWDLHLPLFRSIWDLVALPHVRRNNQRAEL